MLLNYSCQVINWITIMWMMNAMIYVALGKLWSFTINTNTVLSSGLLAQMYVVVLASFPRQLNAEQINNKNTAEHFFLNGMCQK